MKKTIIVVISTVALFCSCGKKTQETKPIRQSVTETVFASGILEANNTYSLTAQADGYLSSVNFEEGDKVQVGNILAIVENQESYFNEESANDLFSIAQRNTQSDAPALLQAQNTIAVNKQKMEQDFVQYQRYKKLWDSNTIAKVDFENVTLQYNTSKTNYQNALESYKLLQQQAQQSVISNKAQKSVNKILVGKNQIKAIVSGKVFKKYKQTGDYVKRGETIALIGDAQHIYAKVSIDEGNIERVKLGQQAVVQLNTNKEKTYKGTVAEIYPSFNEGTQSFTCKIIFNDTLDFNIVNTQLQSNIIVAVNPNALLIPRNYLDFGGNVTIKGKNDKVKVTTKFVSNDWVQVLSGIDENTVLITDNIKDNKVTTSEVGSQMR